MELPSVIPIFALPGVVLFPGVPLPLHIFEPRYRAMVRDVSAGHEVIGMALLRGDWEKDYEGAPDIFETGCAGRLVNVEALPDGRYNIVLHGLREFEIRRHVFDRPYRQAQVAWRTACRGRLAAEDRRRLVDALGRFLRSDPESPAHRLLRDPALTDDLLVNFFSFALDIEPLEKQGLLQAPTLEERGRRLIENIEFHLEAARLAPASRSGPGRCH